MTVKVLAPKDSAAFFHDLRASRRFQDGIERTAADLELDLAPNLIRHYLIQFRLYDDGFVADSVYLSALSTGFFRVPFTAVPLRQIGVKLELETLESGQLNEVYLDPVNRQDFVEAFSNCDRVDFDLDLIGFGIALADMRDVIEAYYWESRGDTINDSVEIRENLISGERTPYFRYALSSGEDTPCPEAFNEAETEALLGLVQSCGAQGRSGSLDDVIIYSHKAGRNGRPYASYYLTSAPV